MTPLRSRPADTRDDGMLTTPSQQHQQQQQQPSSSSPSSSSYTPRLLPSTQVTGTTSAPPDLLPENSPLSRRSTSTRSATPIVIDIQTTDLSFLTGLRSLAQLKCACRRQFGRDPRRATLLFALLKEAFETNKDKQMDEIPAIYLPFFTDLRRSSTD